MHGIHGQVAIYVFGSPHSLKYLQYYADGSSRVLDVIKANDSVLVQYRVSTGVGRPQFLTPNDTMCICALVMITQARMCILTVHFIIALYDVCVCALYRVCD